MKSEIEKSKIFGLKIKPIQKLDDARGALLHFMRKDSPEFQQFGEVYFSLTNYGVIKGWKKHFEMTQNFICPQGEIKIIVFDDRPDSPSRGQYEIIHFSLEQYQLITVPPGLWYSFQALSKPHALIANLTNIPHDPAETTTLPLNDPRFPKVWDSL